MTAQALDATQAATESQVAASMGGTPEPRDALDLNKKDVSTSAGTTPAPTSPASSLPSTASKSQDEVF